MTEKLEEVRTGEPSIKDEDFALCMGDDYMTGIDKMLMENSDTFSFPYLGDDGTPAGCQGDMTCVVICWPTPLANLMVEGLEMVKANLVQVAEQLAKVDQSKVVTLPPATAPAV